MPVPVLSLQNVTRSYGEAETVLALDNVSIDIAPGERVAIMGPSGSGKSTLLNIMCGLDSPTKGKVIFDGRDLVAMSDNERTLLRRHKIGMIFQTFNLLPTLSSVENVALPLRLNGTGLRAASEKAANMLAFVGLKQRLNNRPDEMAGGERQRVAIARSLVLDPLLLLADEPTGNLDTHTGDSILELLDNLHEQLRMTIVLVTHNEHAAERCPRRVLICDGSIVADKRYSEYTSQVEQHAV
jgi:putative ABC transport system ATP-binding protein